MQRFRTKMVNAEFDSIERSEAWALAPRGWLMVDSDSLRFRDRYIPFSEVEDALLFRFKRRPFPDAYVLAFHHHGTPYQFGLYQSPYWEADLPFPVERQQGALGSTPLARVARVAGIVAAILLALAILGLPAFIAHLRSLLSAYGG